MFDFSQIFTKIIQQALGIDPSAMYQRPWQDYGGAQQKFSGSFKDALNTKINQQLTKHLGPIGSLLGRFVTAYIAKGDYDSLGNLRNDKLAGVPFSGKGGSTAMAYRNMLMAQANAIVGGKNDITGQSDIAGDLKISVIRDYYRIVHGYQGAQLQDAALSASKNTFSLPSLFSDIFDPAQLQRTAQGMTATSAGVINSVMKRNPLNPQATAKAVRMQQAVKGMAMQARGIGRIKVGNQQAWVDSTMTDAQVDKMAITPAQKTAMKAGLSKLRANSQNYGGLTNGAVAQLSSIVAQFSDFNIGEIQESVKAFQNKVRGLAKALSPLKDVFGQNVRAMTSMLQDITGQNIDSLARQPGTVQRLATQIADAKLFTGRKPSQIVQVQAGIQKYMAQAGISGIASLAAPSLGTRLAGAVYSPTAQPTYMNTQQFTAYAGSLVVSSHASDMTKSFARAYGIWKGMEENKEKSMQQFLEAYSGEQGSHVTRLLKLTNQSDYTGLQKGQASPGYYQAMTSGFFSDVVARQNVNSTIRSTIQDLAVRDRVTAQQQNDVTTLLTDKRFTSLAVQLARNRGNDSVVKQVLASDDQGRKYLKSIGITDKQVQTQAISLIKSTKDNGLLARVLLSDRVTAGLSYIGNTKEQQTARQQNRLFRQLMGAQDSTGASSWQQFKTYMLSDGKYSQNSVTKLMTNVKKEDFKPTQLTQGERHLLGMLAVGASRISGSQDPLNIMSPEAAKRTKATTAITTTIKSLREGLSIGGLKEQADVILPQLMYAITSGRYQADARFSSSVSTLVNAKASDDDKEKASRFIAMSLAGFGQNSKIMDWVENAKGKDAELIDTFIKNYNSTNNKDNIQNATKYLALSQAVENSNDQSVKSAFAALEQKNKTMYGKADYFKTIVTEAREDNQLKPLVTTKAFTKAQLSKGQELLRDTLVPSLSVPIMLAVAGKQADVLKQAAKSKNDTQTAAKYALFSQISTNLKATNVQDLSQQNLVSTIRGMNNLKIKGTEFKDAEEAAKGYYQHLDTVRNRGGFNTDSTMRQLLQLAKNLQKVLTQLFGVLKNGIPAVAGISNSTRPNDGSLTFTV